ncbi:hypothetical protein BDP27DRAFT_1371059 [Rhodocollybia butyracea]|uniref:Uncharacterized protein n=1 Tax=Rhodocollybia butyracea TaxID=206335 RepID=A0A9P5PD09_9AGAR|nr:hypothetical protein BDP27DRAFT_1371059 [Rhodocollybia butyracea]
MTDLSAFTITKFEYEDCFKLQIQYNDKCANPPILLLQLYPTTALPPRFHQPRPKIPSTPRKTNNPSALTLIPSATPLGGSPYAIVKLNTLGVPDGGFELWVEGRGVIEREDVYYRGTGPGDSGSGSTTTPGTIGIGTGSGSDAAPSSLAGGDEGCRMGGSSCGCGSGSTATSGTPSPGPDSGSDTAASLPILRWAWTWDSGSGDVDPDPESESAMASNKEIPFAGAEASKEPADERISMFFGGHENEWASPRDQSHVWFKWFEMERIA